MFSPGDLTYRLTCKTIPIIDAATQRRVQIYLLKSMFFCFLKASKDTAVRIFMRGIRTCSNWPKRIEDRVLAIVHPLIPTRWLSGRVKEQHRVRPGHGQSIAIPISYNPQARWLRERL